MTRTMFHARYIWNNRCHPSRGHKSNNHSNRKQQSKIHDRNRPLGLFAKGGRNDHNDAGKYDVFPGDNFEAHLIPFLDGGLNLESETGQMAAVMPN